MSRLLTALKRLDDAGQHQSAAPQPAAPPSASPVAAVQQVAAATVASPPATVAFVERRAAPPQSELPQPSLWPSGASSEPDIIALRQPLPSDGTHPGESPPAPRPSRSTNPGRRATDRCRITPEYAAIAKTILDRVSKARPISILIVPATEQIDAGLIVAELSLAIADGLDLPIVAIDADLRRQGSDEASDVATAGLTDVLLDRVDWRGVLTPARDQRVQLLAAGRPLSTSDSLPSAATRLGPIIAEMKTRYRALVVHAGPPQNPLCNALVQASDLIYLVIRLGLTTRRDARNAKRQLERGGASVHGSIVVAHS
jgi:Mrp family chromosome partitioning ATPase